MEKGEKVLIGMSGGIDSSVAALILQQQGYNVIGITLEMFNEDKNNLKCSNTAIEDAKRVCKFLKIPHYIYNVKDEFNKYVIQNFCKCYINCKTPNPCIECNKYLKFGLMYKKAQELGCNYIATGHYAKIKYDDEFKKTILKKSNNLEKDQTYFLWSISKEIMEHILFPLGDYNSKEYVRKLAIKYNLPVTDKKDSQYICFITNGNYKEFLENRIDIKNEEGNIVNKNGEILGKHKGLYYYTIGQRRGLGISSKDPLFVIGFNKEKNEVILGNEEELYKKELLIEDVNLLLFDEIKKPLKVMTKIRYAAKESLSTIYNTPDGKLKVVFEKPQKAITPGQSAVFYLNDIVVGGGKII